MKRGGAVDEKGREQVKWGAFGEKEWNREKERTTDEQRRGGKRKGTVNR